MENIMHRSYTEQNLFLHISTQSSRDCSISTIEQLEVTQIFEDGTMLVKPVGNIISNGTARKDPSDKMSHAIGIGLATGRAIHTLGHRMIKQANGLVKHHDDIKVMRPIQKAKSNRLQEMVDIIIEEVAEDDAPVHSRRPSFMATTTSR